MFWAFRRADMHACTNAAPGLRLSAQELHDWPTPQGANHYSRLVMTGSAWCEWGKGFVVGRAYALTGMLGAYVSYELASVYRCFGFARLMRLKDSQAPKGNNGISARIV